MKTDLIQQFNLPSYIKGKSFSEASKAIDAKFKDRNDKASNETKQALLERLSEAQEYVKMQQGLQNESQQVPDQMNGQIPPGMEEYMPQQPQPQIQQPTQEGQFAGGGFMDQSKEAWNADGAGPTAGIVGGIAPAIEIGKEVFGKTGVDTSGAQHIEKESGLMGGLNLGAQGAAAGAQIGGPLGAAIGGGVGLIGGLIGAKKHNKDAAIANNNFVHSQNAQFRESDFAYGGSMKSNKYAPGGPMTNIPANPLGGITGNIGSAALDSLPKRPINKPITQELQLPSATAGDNMGGRNAIDEYDRTQRYSPVEQQSWAGKTGDWLGKNAGNIMQYAPVASNISELIGLKRGVTERGSRLDNVYQPQEFDKAALVNQLNQRNTEQALKESSGGNLGALRSNLIASGAGKDKAMSEALLKGDDVSRQEGRFKHQADMQKDLTNINLDQNFLDRKAQDTAAYENTKSNLKRALAEDIGKIGKEEVDKKLIKEMFGYKWDGKYFIDKDGKKKTMAEVQKEVDSSKKQSE